MINETRLLGALFFAAVGGAFFWLANPLLATVRPPIFFEVICVGSGLAVGWVLIGRREDKSGVGIGQGLTTSLALAVVILLTSGSFNAMRDAMQFRTGEPMGTIAAAFEKSAEYFFILATPEIVGLIFVSGIVGGGLIGLMSRYLPD